MNIILASQSPRRRELLERVGLKEFQVVSPDVDERVGPGLSPARMVEELSLRKARAAAGKAGPEDVVIAATRWWPWTGRRWASPGTGRTLSPCSPPCRAGSTGYTPG